MNEPPARLWLNQARSDLKAGERVFNATDEGSYCQAIAKYQQVVEKSVKAITAAVKQAAMGSIGTGFKHEVDKLVWALVLIPKGKGPADIKNRIRSLFHEGHRGEIRALCLLAPRKPGPGELSRRNTEYPYQRLDETWIAPHESESFSKTEVERFRRLASRIIEGSAKILSALERSTKPQS